jgi:hypothetical protein
MSNTASSIRARRHTDPILANGEQAEVWNNTSDVTPETTDRTSITPIQARVEPELDEAVIQKEAEGEGVSYEEEQHDSTDEVVEIETGEASESDQPAEVEYADGSEVKTDESGIPVLEAKTPSRGGSRADWAAYAETQSFDTEGLTRDEIAAHFLGTK